MAGDLVDDFVDGWIAASIGTSESIPVPKSIAPPPLAGKVALVTGGSRGIGRAIALDLAKKGAAVVISYVTSVKQALDLVDQITKAGGRAAAIISDVSQPEEVERLFRIVLGAFRGIDIVVNNAAVMEAQFVEHLTEESFDRLFATNSKGAFFVAKHASMHTREGGRIINICNSATHICQAGYSSYLASKATLEALTRSLALELGPRNITINTVSPGYTRTDMSVLVPNSIGKAASVFNRWGDPEDVAHVVSFLVSDQAKWITGQIIQPNGGQVM